MNKIEYIVEAFNERAYVNKSFIQSVFSNIISTEGGEDLNKIPYALHRDIENKQVYFYRGDNKIIVEHDNFDLPLFDKNEKFKVSGKTSKYVEEEIETTAGIYLANIAILKESLHNKVNYINGKIDGNKIKSIIANLMVDNPKDGESIPDGKASVDECLKITKQLDYLEGLNPIFVKASSLDVLTIHPEILKLRDEGLKELEEKGLLNDEIAVATFIDKLIAEDTKIQLSGPSKDFFIDAKFINNARKKMFIIFDMVPNFHTGKYELLVKSLNEGWDESKFASYVNTAVSASYDRGIATGQGGAEVKVVILLTSRIEVGSEDCGVKRTEPVKINNMNVNGWIGGFYLDNNKIVEITKEDSKNLIGKTVQMRVPTYCQEPDDNLCLYCCGRKLGGVYNRVSAETVYIFTQYMLTKMKAMHISQLKTVSFALEDIMR